MPEEPTRNRPRLNTTVAESTMAVLTELTGELNLPHVGVTVDYLVAERSRLLQAVRTVNPSAYPLESVTPELSA